MIALLLLIGLLGLVNPANAASKYYTLGSHRVITWQVDYGRYYYNNLKFQIRLRSPANLVAYTWKDTGNCNNQYFLDRLNTRDHTVNIPYSNSMVVHPWTNGLGNVDVDARNKYCVGLHCHGEKTCYTEYDYYATDGCMSYSCGGFTSGGEVICGRYLGCGCTWNTVWKCNQCSYGPCNCGYHHVQCNCLPHCPRVNKRQDGEMLYDNMTAYIQTIQEAEFLNQDNYLIDKNISVDNCFQNNVFVFNKTQNQITVLENNMASMETENQSLSHYMIATIVMSGFTILSLFGMFIYYVTKQ